jgi:hypothetical protein
MSVNWAIRETRDSDAQALIALLFVSWLDTYENLEAGVTREFILSMNLPHLEYSWLSKKWDYDNFKNTVDNIHFVAVDERGALLGFLHAHRDIEAQHLGGLYVCKEMQGTGLAQNLAAKFLNGRIALVRANLAWLNITQEPLDFMKNWVLKITVSDIFMQKKFRVLIW